MLRILEQTVREEFDVEAEVSRLKAALSNSEDQCNNLVKENLQLYESLWTYQNRYENIIKQNETNEKGVTKLTYENKICEAALSSLEKEYHQFSSDSRPELGALKKSIKSKEKEIYILSTKFAMIRMQTWSLRCRAWR